VVFVLFAVGTSAILTSRMASHATIVSALALIVPGIWLLVAAELNRSMLILLVATTVGGLSCGLGYRGSLEVANGIAPPERRSR
jgi:hypothetical protein